MERPVFFVHLQALWRADFVWEGLSRFPEADPVLENHGFEVGRLMAAW
jgi:hypothetical protein